MTAAETVRAWAADADEAMAPTLIALAEMIDAEVKTEAHYLEPIAQALRVSGQGDSTTPGPSVEAETFSVLAAIERLRASYKVAYQRAECAEQDKAHAEERRQRRRKYLAEAQRALAELRDLDLSSAEIEEMGAGRN